MKRFDIAPFALPNAPAGELKFEESRDIETVEVDFAGRAPATAGLQYPKHKGQPFNLNIRVSLSIFNLGLQLLFKHKGQPFNIQFRPPTSV